MITLYNKWEPQLTKLIETINNKFSEFMESLSYVGEVVLSRKDKVLTSDLLHLLCISTTTTSTLYFTMYRITEILNFYSIY